MLLLKTLLSRVFFNKLLRSQTDPLSCICHIKKMQQYFFKKLSQIIYFLDVLVFSLYEFLDAINIFIYLFCQIQLTPHLTNKGELLQFFFIVKFMIRILNLTIRDRRVWGGKRE